MWPKQAKKTIGLLLKWVVLYSTTTKEYFKSLLKIITKKKAKNNASAYRPIVIIL